MEEKKKFHSVLSSTAVRLSVYSSFLDFGLAVSVFFLQRKLLPAAQTAFLLNLFDTAIAYLTFAIIGLFAAAMVLRLREAVVIINATPDPVRKTGVKRIVVSVPPKNFKEENQKTGVLRVNADKFNHPEIQRVVTRNKQDFIKFNGIWYKVTKESFDKVPRPDY